MTVDNLRSQIITSEAADRMLNRVSPIYDDSYVGLWVFEAIGREYDDLHELISSFPAQAFPDTATWAIELWEKRYDIVPDSSLSLEERRKKVISAIGISKPFTPYILEKLLSDMTGRRAIVEDVVGPYTFGVYLESTVEQHDTDFSAICSTIERYKPSHLSYEIAFQSRGSVILGSETTYWRFPYRFTGTALTGQHPDTAEKAGISSSSLFVTPKADGFIFPYEFTGTLPDISTASGRSFSPITAKASFESYKTAYIPCGTELTGGI